jgi:flagellar protein FlaG
MGMEVTGAIRPAYPRDAAVREPGHGRREVPEERKRAEAQEPQAADIRVNLDKLEKTYRAFNRKLKFYLNEEIGRVVVKVIDAETDKLIKEIPPQEIQELVARIQQAIGVMVDEMI